MVLWVKLLARVAQVRMRVLLTTEDGIEASSDLSEEGLHDIKWCCYSEAKRASWKVRELMLL